MKKIISKILSLSIVFLLAINFIPAEAATNTDNTNINLINNKQAEKVARAFVNDEIGTQSELNWKNGIDISTSQTLFDLDENPSAYLFQLVDSNKQPNGYIVVNANKALNPIVEFSDTGSSFLNTAIDSTANLVDNKNSKKHIKRKQVKLYYTGNLNYMVEHELDDNSKEDYDVSTNNYVEVDKEKLREGLKSQINQTDMDKYKGQWDHLVSSSNPPDSSGKGPITSPDSYESGYVSKTSKDVTGYNLSYKIGSDYSENGSCGPLAGTNIAYYYYNKNKTKYSILNSSYIGTDFFGTFESLYSCMGTSSVGTYIYNVLSALMSFFNGSNVNLHAYSDYFTWYSDYSVMNEINNNRPFILAVYSHYYYGNHALLGLGYIQYRYSVPTGGSWYSTYIRVADGVVRTPSRFVWSGCAGDWDYVTLSVP